MHASFLDDGYIPLDGIIAIFVQRKRATRRIIVCIEHAKSNIDG